MTGKPTKRGGSTAPAELLYAMVVATGASIEHPDDKALSLVSDELVELLIIAESLPVEVGEKSISMEKLLAAATGFMGFEGDAPTISSELIVPKVRDVVLKNVAAQEFLNNYMKTTLGWVFNFSPQPDNYLFQLMKADINRGTEIS